MQSQYFNWVTSVTGSESEYGVKSVKDVQGNTYIIGYTTGNPFVYEGVNYTTNGAGGDAFFAKIDADKELIWMRSIGGNDHLYFDEALDIHIDPFGDIYLTFKSCSNNFTYNGQILGGISAIGQYGGEGVLLKVNSNGDYLWHDSGTVASSFKCVTTDVNGNVYLVGDFRQTITLGGSITLTNPSPDTTADLLVAKYQPNGTILWAKRAGGMPHNTFAFGMDIEIHPQTGEVIVLGKGEGAVIFDGLPMPTANGSDKGIVLISYDTDGSQNWVKRLLDVTSNAFPYGLSLDISDSGVMGVCGRTFSSGLIGFYTGDGSVISEQNYPSSNHLTIETIAFNEFNEAYISGRSDGSAVLGVGPGMVTLPTTGFVAKMDLFQQVAWVEQIPVTTVGQIHYENGIISYAGRIDSPFTYNSGQNVIINNLGDAIFGEIIDYQLPTHRCNITGTVFQDVDSDCVLDPSDIVQKSVVVVADNQNGLRHFSISDANGHYDIPVGIGTYDVKILPNPIQSTLVSQNCYTQQQVSLSATGQDANGINFPIELSACPLLNLDVCSDRRRRCFESNTYVSYRNSGFAEAQDAQVMVRLPEYVTFVSSDHPYVVDALGNYVFSLGTLEPNESGQIHIVDSTQCENGITGLTQCTEAWIIPRNDCADALDPDFETWDRSIIDVQGTCTADSTVQFTITNVSPANIGNMSGPHPYRIFVDNALATTSAFQLDGGESITINYPANGQTIRLEADQHPAYPGNSYDQYTVEACGSNATGGVSTGFVNAMDVGDGEVDKEVHCLEIIDSFDPNDKIVSPTGITNNHYVSAGTTLEYMIRFQNTGTDTAYKVIVKDSLPQYLDPATIQFGVSSHPYSIHVTGNEAPVLEFTFNDINLPHSASNEPGSHGFVKFKARTYDFLENGIEVNNNANIYFDYNYPILTNTVQVVISDFELLYDPLAIPSTSVESAMVYPNPTLGLLVVEAANLQRIEVYNVAGLLVETSDWNRIDLSSHPGGIYFLKIITDNGSTSKKIILK